MRTSTVTLMGALTAFSSFVAAHPLTDATLENLFKRAVSPDNTCGFAYAGNGNNYTCGTSNQGTCCSQYGYCGGTADYCGTGCQSDFGACTGGGDTTTPTTPTTDPYICGSTNSGLSCDSGLCCSQYGYCGNTTDYCEVANGCQATYGICDGGEDSGDDALCGPMNNGAVCGSGKCCSPAGYCGTTEDYCRSPDCLVGYGICDASTTPAGASTASIARTLLGSVPYGQDIYDCNDPGHIALTYDDGPYLYTNDLLDLLASYGFKATFFITGINNGKGAIDTTAPYPAVIQRMIADGHQVASHTWSHANLSSLTDADRETEMIKNEMALRNVIGKIPTYMRPPYSACNDACKATMVKLGYHITYFDLDTQDYLHTTPETNQISKDVVHNYLVNANPATTDFLSIAHDIHDQTVHNLTAYMFDQMVTYGFTGVTAGKCLNDPEANWYRDASGTSSVSSSSVSSSTSTVSSSSSSVSSSSSTTTTTSSTSTTSSSLTSTTPSSTSSSSTSSSVSSTTSSTTSSTSTTPTSSSTSSSPTSSSVSSTSSTKSSTSSSSSVRVTPSSTTSSAAPTTTATCVGKWCARPLNKFTKTAGCWGAYADCYADVAACILRNRGSKDQCNSYGKKVCDKLEKFCSKCGWGSCNSSGFKH